MARSVGRATRRTVDMLGVITSYSIHYTKLYDDAAFCGEYLRAARELRAAGIDTEVYPEAVAGRYLYRRPVITSYSIHYTKLYDDAAYRAVVSSFEGSGMAVVRVDAAASPDEVEAAVWSAIEPISKGRARRYS